VRNCFFAMALWYFRTGVRDMGRFFTLCSASHRAANAGVIRMNHAYPVL